jgi:IS5 family transposase
MSKSRPYFGLIRVLEVTMALTNDNQIDVSEEGEVVYRDRGCSGAHFKGFDAAMQRGVRGYPIGIWDPRRNSRISWIRSPGEQLYVVIKNVFHSAHPRVATVIRVPVKMLIARSASTSINGLHEKTRYSPAKAILKNPEN